MRKARNLREYLLPDLKFNDPLGTKFVNYMMERGKKNVAYNNVFYDAIEIVEKGIWKRPWSLETRHEQLMPGVGKEPRAGLL